MITRFNPQPETGQDRSDRSGTRLTILLADDEAAIRTFAGAVLRSHGYEVLEAADGVEALELAERRPGPIHLLLTDWRMPRLGGDRLICDLRARRPGTAVLVITGFFDGEPPNEVILPKPFTPGALVQKVEDLLNSKPGT